VLRPVPRGTARIAALREIATRLRRDPAARTL